MKASVYLPRLWLCLFLAAAAFVGAGCATSENDLNHVSERPWDQPVGWENGLPSSMSEGR